MMTFDELAQIVLDQRAEDGIRGIERERSRYRVHIGKAAFAHMPLDQIGSKEIADWFREMARKHPQDARGEERLLSHATIQRSRALVSVVLGEAVTRGLIPHNPSRGVRIRKRADEAATKDKWAFLSPEEQRTLTTCERIPEADRLAIRFAIATGLRQGEQFNLLLENVVLDGDDPHLDVRYGAKGKPPKNGKARRVPLFGDGVVATREWLEMLPNFSPSNPEHLVFPTSTGRRRAQGKPLGRSSVWHAHLKAAGVRRVRWHDLRHTCASSLVMGSWGRTWNLMEVRDMLGHSAVNITERYAHLSDTALKQAARGTSQEAPAKAQPRGIMGAITSAIRAVRGAR
jgi:integrase